MVGIPPHENYKKSWVDENGKEVANGREEAANMKVEGYCTATDIAGKPVVDIYRNIGDRKESHPGPILLKGK